MTFQITLTPSQKIFRANADETLLDAALRAGIVLPYGCKDGACGSCKAHTQSGQWAQLDNTALTKDEINTQAILPCCAQARSDMTLLVREVRGLDDFPVRKLPVRIKAIERPETTIAIVHLQLPATEQFLFKAGQYIDLIVQDGQRRSFSLANAPHEANTLVLHIRHNPKGLFSRLLFPDLYEGEAALQNNLRPLQERDILRFEGPLGSFFLREDSDKPMILLASGTGFAPIRSLIEHARHLALKRPMHLYWGGRRPQELYDLAQCQAWCDAISDFTFVPVISDPQAEDHWQGRTGLVHQAVMEDFADLSEYEVYACGAPIMVKVARSDFSGQRMLSPDNFFADSFEAAPCKVVTPAI